MLTTVGPATPPGEACGCQHCTDCVAYAGAVLEEDWPLAAEALESARTLRATALSSAKHCCGELSKLEHYALQCLVRQMADQPSAALQLMAAVPWNSLSADSLRDCSSYVYHLRHIFWPDRDKQRQTPT